MDIYFKKKQEQLYIWVRYKQFVTFHEADEVCFSLIQSDSEEVQKWYGKHPVYKLFIPLVLNGIFEISILNEQQGFSLSKRISLISEKDLIDDFEFKKHFSLKEGPSITEKELRELAFNLLKKTPNIKEYIIKDWNEDKYFNIHSVYIQKNPFTNMWSSEPLEIKSSCICRRQGDYESRGYIIITDNLNKKRAFKIPNNDFDAIFISRLLIGIENNCFSINYKENSHELSFINYNKNANTSIPIFLYRPLLLLNINQLVKDDIYYPERNGLPFSGVDNKIYLQLKRILGA